MGMMRACLQRVAEDDGVAGRQVLPPHSRHEAGQNAATHPGGALGPSAAAAATATAVAAAAAVTAAAATFGGGGGVGRWRWALRRAAPQRDGLQKGAELKSRPPREKRRG